MMRRVLSVVVTLAGMGTLEAADSPSLEACARYAEADAAYEAAMREPLAVFEAAKQAAEATYEAAVQGPEAILNDAMARTATARLEAVADPREGTLAIFEAAIESQKTALELLKSVDEAARAAYEVAMHEPLAVFEAAVQGPEADRQARYVAIYAEDGEVRSEVPEVMAKLRNGHRQRCRDLHGL